MMGKGKEEMQSKERLKELLKYPKPKQRIGIVHLSIVQEERCLYGMRSFTSPGDAVEMLRPLFAYADRELVLVLSLNGKNEAMALEVVAVGGLNACYTDVGNIFKHAILNNSAGVICFHNHPSGDPEPSREDKLLTRRLERCGKILGIELVDHIVLGGDGRYFSFKKEGFLPGCSRREELECR
ncbi:DNA repair protein RadC [Lachnoclostridium sp. An14]|uniref:JAB domain-containing protein n=1 Tax=Lachnoclostridium sp. An14 TaxID=1965562 RepID=UPI000B56759D|nr:JAB domain-containing protein [Lachnoclostridium sp. An14]OUQ13523.1 DNA repair protein RadC [Lachnoclostridium sp. An14]